MKKIIKNLLVLIGNISLNLFYWFLTLKIAFAQDRGVTGETPGQGVSAELPNPLKVQTIAALIDNIVSYLMKISVPIVAVMVIIGGFYILTAAGNPEKFKKGKNVILYAVIGFAIILLAKGITAIIKQILGVQEGSK